MSTYKYDWGSNEYDTSEKRRIRAWCDRILHRARDPERVQNIFYRQDEPNISDHRPVCGGYIVEIKKVQHTERAKQLQIAKSLWIKEERRLLDDAQAFYLDVFEQFPATIQWTRLGLFPAILWLSIIL